MTVHNIFIHFVLDYIYSSSEDLMQDRKRFPAPAFPGVKQPLLVCFKDILTRNFPISSSCLKKKVNSLEFLLGFELFKASTVWIYCCNYHHNIDCCQLCSEAAA